jgi:hypothetical protein
VSRRKAFVILLHRRIPRFVVISPVSICVYLCSSVVNRAFDFFLRHPQPRTIALCVSTCDVKLGVLSDDGRDETHGADTTFGKLAVLRPDGEHSNRNRVRIEIAVTYRKQRRASSSNRNYFRGSSNGSCRSRITNHDSRFTRHSSQTNATPRPSNHSRPVLQWLIRARYRLETPAGVAASNDLGMGQRKTA